MASRITSRIAAETGIPHLFPALADDISPTDLQSLLLEVYQNRARGIKESGILARAGQRPLFAPSSVDARLLNQFDRIAFAAAENFEAVDLSPVSPFGTNFVLGGIDQNNLLTTIRNAEVLGDSTPAMAVECARRRRKPAQRSPGSGIRLCASHRVVRLQPFDLPGFTPHFRLFAMVSAGRDMGSRSFEIQSLVDHIGFYLRLFRELNAEGFSLTAPLIELSDVNVTESLLTAAGVSRDEVRESIRAHKPGGSERFLAERGITFPGATDAALKERVFDPLQAQFPEAEFRFDPARLEGLGYYTGWCLRISPTAPDGNRYAIADGGFTDWTARLLEDKKERLLTSGIGSEFVCRRYKAS